MSAIRAILRAAVLAGSVSYNAFVATVRLTNGTVGAPTPTGDYVEAGYVEAGYI